MSGRFHRNDVLAALSYPSPACRPTEVCGQPTMASTSTSVHGRRVHLLPTRPPPTFVRSAGVQVVEVALLALLLHSVLVTAGIGEEATVMVNLVFAFVVLSVASFAGLDQRDIGLVTSREGWLLAAATGGTTAVLVVVAAALGLVPSDAAVAALPTPAVWFRVLVAIPIGTAVCEEIIFRGALLATLDRLTTTRWSTVITSALFGLWHVAAEASRTGALGLGVLPGVLATAAVSAFVLIPLRRRSGDLAAPIAVHAVANVGVFAAVLLASG